MGSKYYTKNLKFDQYGKHVSNLFLSKWLGVPVFFWILSDEQKVYVILPI